MKIILDLLHENKEETYACFQRKLIPNLSSEKILGVRTPILKDITKQISKLEESELFLCSLPHVYFEENQIHGFLISAIKDFNLCIQKLEAFLPYIDNWATCDQTSPKIFKKHKQELLPYIKKWLASKHTYTIRFAIGMLMKHFLEEDFKEEYLLLVSSIDTEAYYVKMEIAWFMATALAKQWDSTIQYLEEKKLDLWIHKKTIQKAKESYRITSIQKKYLETLK